MKKSKEIIVLKYAFSWKSGRNHLFLYWKKEMLSSNTNFTLESCRYRQKTLYLHMKSVQKLADRAKI